MFFCQFIFYILFNLYLLHPKETKANTKDKLEELNELIATLEPYGLSGTFLIAKKDSIFFLRSVGWQDKTNLNSNSTEYEIMSLTKLFLANSYLILEDRGVLKLSDKVSKYIGKFPNGEEPTIQQLLNHTAGFSNSGSTLNRQSNKDYIESFKRMPFVFEPGSDYLYSNPAYGLGAVIIEEITKSSFKDFVEKNIIEPAGMNHTFFNDNKIDNYATGFSGFPGQYREFPAPQIRIGVLGPTGLVSTVTDLFRWKLALFSSKIISPKSLQKFFEADKNNYGLGWMFNLTKDGRKRIFKDGAWPSYESIFAIYPDEDYVIIFTMNNFMAWRFQILELLEDIIFDHSYKLPPKVWLSIKESKDFVSDLSGKYVIENYGKIELNKINSVSYLCEIKDIGLKSLFGFRKDNDPFYPNCIFLQTGKNQITALRTNTKNNSFFSLSISFHGKEKEIDLIKDNNKPIKGRRR